MGFLDYFHYQNFLLLVMLGGGLAALVGCIISTVAHFNDEGYYIGISLVNAIGIVGALAGFFLYIGLSFDFFGKGGSFCFILSLCVFYCLLLILCCIWVLCFHIKSFASLSFMVHLIWSLHFWSRLS